VNIYLNDVPEENKGATRILKERVDNNYTGNFTLDVLGKVQPVQGMASVFRESVYHDGESVSDGVKYLLRSDLMFEREEQFDWEKVSSGLGGVAKANKALNISYALQDGGNSLEADEWRAMAFEYNFFN